MPGRQCTLDELDDERPVLIETSVAQETPETLPTRTEPPAIYISIVRWGSAIIFLSPGGTSLRFLFAVLLPINIVALLAAPTGVFHLYTCETARNASPIRGCRLPRPMTRSVSCSSLASTHEPAAARRICRNFCRGPRNSTSPQGWLGSGAPAPGAGRSTRPPCKGPPGHASSRITRT